MSHAVSREITLWVLQRVQAWASRVIEQLTPPAPEPTQPVSQRDHEGPPAEWLALLRDGQAGPFTSFSAAQQQVETSHAAAAPEADLPLSWPPAGQVEPARSSGADHAAQHHAPRSELLRELSRSPRSESPREPPRSPRPVPVAALAEQHASEPPMWPLRPSPRAVALPARAAVAPPSRHASGDAVVPLPALSWPLSPKQRATVGPDVRAPKAPSPSASQPRAPMWPLDAGANEGVVAPSAAPFAAAAWGTSDRAAPPRKLLVPGPSVDVAAPALAARRSTSSAPVASSRFAELASPDRARAAEALLARFVTPPNAQWSALLEPNTAPTGPSSRDLERRRRLTRELEGEG